MGFYFPILTMALLGVFAIRTLCNVLDTVINLAHDRDMPTVGPFFLLIPKL